MMNKLLGVIRAPFLLLVPASLAPAMAVAWVELGRWPLRDLLLVLLGAVSAHVAVNALNEYQDFRSGLDLATRRTPFSGGSGTLVRHPEFAATSLAIAASALVLTFAVGLYYLFALGSIVILPGLAGLAVIVAYTRWLNRYPLACLLAPGFGFGVVMVNLGAVALMGRYDIAVLAASLVVALLASHLLLINQLPDIEADRSVGRRHLAIAWGVPAAAGVSFALVLGVYAVVIAAAMTGVLPKLALLGLLTAPLAVSVSWRARRFDPAHPEDFIPAMGLNVIVTLSTPVLLAVGIVLGGVGDSAF